MGSYLKNVTLVCKKNLLKFSVVKKLFSN